MATGSALRFGVLTQTRIGLELGGLMWKRLAEGFGFQTQAELALSLGAFP